MAAYGCKQEPISSIVGLLFACMKRGFFGSHVQIMVIISLCIDKRPQAKSLTTSHAFDKTLVLDQPVH